jgi:hypothetical protein
MSVERAGSDASRRNTQAYERGTWDSVSAPARRGGRLCRSGSRAAGSGEEAIDGQGKREARGTKAHK